MKKEISAQELRRDFYKPSKPRPAVSESSDSRRAVEAVLAAFLNPPPVRNDARPIAEHSAE